MAVLLHDTEHCSKAVKKQSVIYLCLVNLLPATPSNNQYATQNLKPAQIKSDLLIYIKFIFY